MVLTLWWIRDKHERFDPVEVYKQWSSMLGLGYHSKSPKKTSNVVIDELDDYEPCTKYLALDWRDNHVNQEDANEDNKERENGNRMNENVYMVDENGNRVDEDGNRVDENAYMLDENGNRVDENGNRVEDDRIVDKDNIVHDVIIDMRSFKANIEGNHDDIEDEGNDYENGDDVGCDLDDFESGSEDENGNVLEAAVRKYRKRMKKSKMVEEVPFYVGQKFNNKKEIRELVTDNAVKTRRQLHILRNESNRFRVVCLGVNPVLVSGGSNSKKDETCGFKSAHESFQEGGASSSTNKSKYQRPTPTCSWKLYLSRKSKLDSWIVKTYHEEHECLQIREVRLYTVSSIAREIEQIVDSNLGIPLRALQDMIQKKHQVQVGLQKIFRAKVMAVNKVHGDYSAQYILLRDYCEELRRSNPGTTVKIDVEREANPGSATRQFRRIYVCFGSMKAGFKMLGREILGLDGCFMKGPFPGQILTAVGVDGNNGIYPVAFAIVESECTSSWTWFLNNLGDDLDLYANSNFTIVSDRQKGVIPAIHNKFPAAEHRHCLRHIHENMKSKWRGNLYKDMLWKAASVTTVPQFNKQMDKIKEQDPSLHKWLQDMPPKHWARSHFSGRSKCDVLLNNLCEVFNKQLVGGRDKPIITCLEYIREYMMRRINVVNKMIAKWGKPLTPTATKAFEQIKNEASQYIVSFNGKDKYQVTGPWNNQHVVNMETRTCSCRKWELTGMPCKHAVAVNWDMVKNCIRVGLPETWVDEAYWTDTWKKVYNNCIDPIYGREMWTSSSCPTTLLPPKHHVQVGRPKKVRKKSVEELSHKINKDGKLTREGVPSKCGICKNYGHNKRTCKGQGSSSLP
ncbi:hypothetical protein QVD17_38268 [Tagetes erecta]|uniref:SWIM-type domain-containing protein n=1 Tax=Tagetes erecta TaxID=13708 RepID=A0AAD8NKR8_TARER|nr:hypothetical protein QVD17_38268 [Tagetes erecta]